MFCWNSPEQPELCKPAGSTTDTTFTFLTTDHIKTPVRVSGVGQPCMFIAGGPGGGYASFREFGGSNLESFLTMIYMDPRGSGTAQDATDYSMERILKDIDDVRASLHIEKMFLMSHSFGGVLLINYARKYPQHVIGLILVNSTLQFQGPDELAEQIRFGYNLLGKDTLITSRRPNTLYAADMKMRDELNKKDIGYKLLTDSLFIIHALNSYDRSHPRTNDFAYAVMWPVLDTTKQMRYPEYYRDYTGLTAQVYAPALVINGKYDHAIGPNHFRRFKFPHQQTININGGHLLYYDNNREFVSAVRNFIDTVQNE